MQDKSTHIQTSHPLLKARKIGWCLSIEQLHLFYTLLIQHSLIAFIREEFENHFFGINDCLTKIVWYGEQIELSYLFDKLIDAGIIPRHRSWHKLLYNHFMKYDEIENKAENFDYDNLRKNYSKNSINGKSEKMIDEIISKILKKINL